MRSREGFQCLDREPEGNRKERDLVCTTSGLRQLLSEDLVSLLLLYSREAVSNREQASSITALSVTVALFQVCQPCNDHPVVMFDNILAPVTLGYR
ncbi:hypothetical protein J6590_088967 [Homalodisca vitripennis]|nr:hypothetical protein J6590_088967 [Homalodisca vitripennis]